MWDYRCQKCLWEVTVFGSFWVSHLGVGNIIFQSVFLQPTAQRATLWLCTRQPRIYALVPPEMSRMVQGATQKPHGEDTVTGRNQNSLPKSHPALHKNSNLQILRNKTSKEASILCKLKYRNGAVKRTLGFYSALFGCGVAAKGVLLLFGRTAQNPQQTHSLPSLHTEEVLPCPAGLQDLFLKAKHFKRFNEIKLWHGLSQPLFMLRKFTNN